MSTITITGTVSDGQGSAPFSVTVQTDSVNIQSAIVAPLVAAPGTMRTLTIVATSGLASPAWSGTLNSVGGITLTPVPGQPAGTFVWTFIY